MGKDSMIEWCDHTFNPWIGCTEVSPACAHCYARVMMQDRYHRVEWGDDHPRVRTSANNWRQPLRWNEAAKATGVRARVFCASLADVFDNRANNAWRCDLWDLIAETPNLDWLLLTKRPENIPPMLPTRPGALRRWDDDGYPNVWLGTTAENENWAALRIPRLLRVRAARHFVSAEPLLSDPGDWQPYLTPPSQWSNGWLNNYPFLYPDKPLDWVITGGESGPGARPSHPDWFRSLRDQCTAGGVPFFFKQWGEYRPLADGAARADTITELTADGVQHRPDFNDPKGTLLARVGKKAAGALLDGVVHTVIPREAT